MSRGKIVAIASLLALLLLYAYFVHPNKQFQRRESLDENVGEKYEEPKEQYPPRTRHILVWTHNHTVPMLMFFNRAGGRFVGCPHSNCVVTNDRTKLPVAQWDAILFHAPEYVWDYKPRVWQHGFPSERSANQVYVLTIIESAANYHITDERWNGYFNWTMTYRLDSDIPWIYFAVENATDGTVVAPKIAPSWLPYEAMRELSAARRSELLANKTVTAAWVVSNCNALSKREKYADALRRALAARGHRLDVYGKCGTLKCNTDNNDWEGDCVANVSQYRFYLAFENSFSPYYVTEKLAKPMRRGVVPVVFGGADYSQFAPPRSYVNANNYSPRRLAQLIDELSRDDDAYAQYFKWTNHYRYRDPYEKPEMNPFCKLCEALNDPRMTSPQNPNQKKYEAFTTWWKN